jgi:diguanylate cyclase (GGDEF)-like protein
MPDINKLFEKAQKYLQKQKFESALETYQEIFRYEPNDEEVLLNLGDLSLKLNRTTDGIRYSNLLIDFYVKKNDPARAVGVCRKVLKITPQDAALWMKLGGLLEKSKKSADALEAYREALNVSRRAGASGQVFDCLQRIVQLDPENLEARVELAQEAERARQIQVAVEAYLQAATLARQGGNEDRWGEMVERAHALDPADEAANVAAAELHLQRGQPAEALALLEPAATGREEDLAFLNLLAQAYVGTGAFDKAEPLAWRLYQERPETVGLMQKVLEGFVQTGRSEKALGLANKLKSRLFQQGKRNDYLRIVEKIYEADESNLPVLEMLTGLYSELNREELLSRSLTRLFSLYLAAEQHDKAADTLERIIDVDPYGAGHYDRLVMLEGHIDGTWYGNIAARVQPPSSTGVASAAGGAGAAEAKPGSLDDLIIEGEMYLQYQLTSRLKETLERIQRSFPGAEQDNPRLLELYQAAGITPPSGPTAAPSPAARAAEPIRAPAAGPSAQSLDELRKISEITANIYRESTPLGVLQVAVNELGRALNASRCWAGLGGDDRPPALTAEYCSPATRASDIATAVQIYMALIRQVESKPDGWLMEDVNRFDVLEPVREEVQRLQIRSLLAQPLREGDSLVGLVLIEQCESARRWTPGESILLQTIATQVVVAVKNSKLRRLVKSLAGTDEETGLLPRSSYIDCLLSEAARAKETSHALSVCLVEPENPTALVKTLGDAGMQRYMKQVAKTIQSGLRQNDISIRYSPATIAVLFPDTALVQGGLAVEKLRRMLSQVRLDGGKTPAFCAAVCEVPLGPQFDAVDGVTEVINRLEGAMETARREGSKRVQLSKFEN